jgi:molybdopterin-containing oxidoreductase family membrane subunit
LARNGFQRLERGGALLGALLTVNALVVLAGLGAAHVMDQHGHVVTGMNNQIVWGIPHVFAVFLIVTASGALNFASLASVFGRVDYKAYARLSGLLAMALLVGGLAVLVLDLGRPDRLIVAMTTYNFQSIFAWNIYLYLGFLAVVAIYLFVLMDRRASRADGLVRSVGGVAFAWRLILTTGTGSIFGWLIAREAYDAAIMAPLFIAASLLYGSAFVVLMLALMGALAGQSLVSAQMSARIAGLIVIFLLAVLYFTVLQHLTNIYAGEHRGIERFLLLEGGRYTALFWLGQILVGSVLPLAILAIPPLRARPGADILACALVLLGGLAQMFVIIIGGQAYPLTLFPGMEVTSSFHDGRIAYYRPSLPEILLGLSGVSIALLIAAFAVRLLPFLPRPAR